MADLDLLSYERDSRWMPKLSWTYPDWTLQQRMETQAAQREQAWQKIADKLGPLLIGSSFGQSDHIVRDIDEDEEYLERAYEKAPLLSSPNISSCSTTNTTSTATNYRSHSQTPNRHSTSSESGYTGELAQPQHPYLHQPSPQPQLQQYKQHNIVQSYCHQQQPQPYCTSQPRSPAQPEQEPEEPAEHQPELQEQNSCFRWLTYFCH